MNHKINVAKLGKYITAKREENLTVYTEGGRKITIKRALLYENLSSNLLSVIKLKRQDLKYCLKIKRCL